MVPTPVFTHDGEDVSFESRSFSVDMETDLTPTLEPSGQKEEERQTMRKKFIAEATKSLKLRET